MSPRSLLRSLLLACAVLTATLTARSALAQDGPGVAHVRSLYAAFAKGDVAAILAGLADDVDWEIVGPRAACPCYGKRKGKQSVAEFFKEIGERHDYKAFTPQEYHASGNTVIVLGRHEMTLRRTGRAFAADWVHVFRLDGGKVSSFRELTDSAAYVEASR